MPCCQAYCAGPQSASFPRLTCRRTPLAQLSKPPLPPMLSARSYWGSCLSARNPTRSIGCGAPEEKVINTENIHKTNNSNNKLSLTATRDNVAAPLPASKRRDATQSHIYEVGILLVMLLHNLNTKQYEVPNNA